VSECRPGFKENPPDSNFSTKSYNFNVNFMIEPNANKEFIDLFYYVDVYHTDTRLQRQLPRKKHEN
jgi:hypothetical protein